MRCQLTENDNILIFSFSGREVLLCFSLAFLFALISQFISSLSRRSKNCGKIHINILYLGLQYLSREKNFFDFIAITKAKFVYFVSCTFKFGLCKICHTLLLQIF